MLAGARPADVVGAILADGPGLAGGPTFPTSQSFFVLPEHHGPPDPYALVELTHDLRPPDYAAAFVRLALAGSPLDEPITRAAVFQPAVAGGGGRRARRRPHVDPRRPASATPACERFRAAGSRARAWLAVAGVRRDGAAHRGDPPLRDARHRDGAAPQPPPAAPTRLGGQRRLPGDVRRRRVRRPVDRVPRAAPRRARADRRRRSRPTARRTRWCTTSTSTAGCAGSATTRPALLERLAAAHELHHRFGGAPYGMLVPVVPRRRQGPGVSRRAGRGRPTSLTRRTARSGRTAPRRTTARPRPPHDVGVVRGERANAAHRRRRRATG